jgi:hypothetical protein
MDGWGESGAVAVMGVGGGSIAFGSVFISVSCVAAGASSSFSASENVDVSWLV